MPFLPTDGFLRPGASITYPTLEIPDGTLVLFTPDTGAPGDLSDTGTATLVLTPTGNGALTDLGIVALQLVPSGAESVAEIGDPPVTIHPTGAEALLEAGHAVLVLLPSGVGRTADDAASIDSHDAALLTVALALTEATTMPASDRPATSVTTNAIPTPEAEDQAAVTITTSHHETLTIR